MKISMNFSNVGKNSPISATLSLINNAKNLSKNLAQLSLATALLLTSLTSLAKDRYLVVYKSQQGFNSMSRYFTTNEFAPQFLVQKELAGIHGMVIKTSNKKAIESLRSHPEVAGVEAETYTAVPRPVNGFKISKTQGFQPTWSLNNSLNNVDQSSQDFANDQTPTSSSLNLVEGPSTPWGIMAVNTGAAWALSDAGAKATVLVLDTGIDPQHPALKGAFVKGRNFYESDNGLDVNDFIDKEGHGTHCSGTIAGTYNPETGFTGVAPLAKILMSRVCGELGCSNIAVAEGINWGIKEKVDVISMSLGGPMSSSAERTAVSNAEKAGVTVVAASGNDGTGKVSFPAALPTPIAVGAVDVTITKTSFSQWGPELDIVAPGAAVVSTVPRGTGRDSVVDIIIDGQKTRVRSAAFSGTKLTSQARVGDLVPAGLGKPEDFQNIDVAGKIALIRRGEITFADKVKNAIAAKAVGVVVYNNTVGLMQGAVTEDGSELDVAVVMVEKSLGLSLLEAINKGGKTSAEISLAASDYAMYDGTSMATPHVAGVVALIKSANKKLTPAQIRTIVAKTAKPLSPNTKNEYGAGLIQADKAVQAAKEML